MLRDYMETFRNPEDASPDPQSTTNPSWGAAAHLTDVRTHEEPVTVETKS